MKKRILISIALLVALSLLAMTGCTGATTTQTTTATEATTTEPAKPGLTDGRFDWKDPLADLETYVHFSDDGTYYAFFFGGGVTEAGVYELLDEELDYYSGPGPDEDYATVEDNETATASQVVVFRSYNGKVQKVAYVDNELRDMNLGGMSEHQTMAQDPNIEYDPSTEMPIVVRQYFFENQEGSSLTLYHNRTFVDYTGDMGEEGTWEMTEDGNFTLTADGANSAYTLTIGDMGATYTKGNTTIDLSSTTGEGAVMVFMVEGIMVGGLPMPVDMHIDCMADGTVTAYVYVAAVDADLMVDTGTYTVADVYKYTFNFETAGEILGEPDFSTATESSLEVNVPYTADVVANFNDAETPMSIDTVLNGTVTVE